ncbi:hypothetical protein VTN77DRAFT_309 [Rasamsonia byssochlamydoides]|uniref:uncharacterized protein n=1 Tax=Rasamsonia byssochlamydoides TaxID=89139 RepID=UPI00374248AB
MQFSHALIALVAAGLANAQFPNIPTCSINCLVTALSNDGCSSLTDFACHCEKPNLVSEVTPCVQKACSVADQSAVSSVVVSECSAAGHPISVPPVGSGSSTSPAASSSPSETVTPSVSAQDSSSASATATGSSSAVPTPVVGSSPAPMISAPSPTVTGSSNSTGAGSSSSASPSTPIFTGAASNVMSNMGGVAGAVAAVAAYFL